MNFQKFIGKFCRQFRQQLNIDRIWFDTPRSYTRLSFCDYLSDLKACERTAAAMNAACDAISFQLLQSQFNPSVQDQRRGRPSLYRTSPNITDENEYSYNFVDISNLYFRVHELDFGSFLKLPKSVTFSSNDISCEGWHNDEKDDKPLENSHYIVWCRSHSVYPHSTSLECSH